MKKIILGVTSLGLALAFNGCGDENQQNNKVAEKSSVKIETGTKWETGFAMGTSTYSLHNENNEGLLLECSEQSANIYLSDSEGKEVNISPMVSALINGVNYESIIEVNRETIPEGKVIWKNFINKIPESNKISIMTGIGKFEFQPINSGSISDIKKTCNSFESNEDNYANTIQNIPSKPPVKINASILTQGYMQVPVVDIIAVTDEVIVNKVIGNRGNCPITSYSSSKLPVTLKYGQKVNVGFLTSCNLIEVEVVTDKGNWTVEY
jgi:hypothetical protein